MKSFTIHRTEYCDAVQWYDLTIDEQDVADYNQTLTDYFKTYECSKTPYVLTMQDIYDIANADSTEEPLKDELTEPYEFTQRHVWDNEEKVVKFARTIEELVRKWIQDDLWDRGYSDYEVRDTYETNDEIEVED